MMHDGLIKNQRGMALLVTVAFVAMVVSGSLLLTRKVRSAYQFNAVSGQRAKLYHMAASGTTAAKMILIKDKKESEADSLSEEWADPKFMNGVLNRMPFDQGEVAVVISDERGRIQVNALVAYPGGQEFNESQRRLFDRFLDFIGIDEKSEGSASAGAIVDALKDWIDSGDDDATTGLGGAETDYYRALDPPYSCGNGPLRHESELALVKGLTPEVLKGSSDRPGIGNYLTTFGMTQTGQGQYTYDGTININTADIAVIAALLPPESRDLALAIYEYRQLLVEEKDVASLSKPDWFKDAPGCKDLEIERTLIGVKSDLFRIESTASLDKMKLALVTVIKREKQEKTGKWICRVLQQEVK